MGLPFQTVFLLGYVILTDLELGFIWGAGVGYFFMSFVLICHSVINEEKKEIIRNIVYIYILICLQTNFFII